MSTNVTIAPPLPERPYRGIREFRFVDQQIFAAREDEVWDLTSNVTLYRAVLLYGDSGIGKSSLINAGFLPQALQEQYVPDRLRVQPFAGREIKVERIATSGGDHPSYLRSNFNPAETGCALAEAESFELPISALWQQLKQLYSRPAQTEDADNFLFGPNTTPRPLLIFDQFEEFITLFEEAELSGPTAEAKLAKEQAREVQRAILEMLVALIQGNTIPVTIIFSFREDYLPKLSALFDACPELRDQSQRLLPPAVEELHKIIRAPFKNDVLRKHFLDPLARVAEPGSEITESLAQKVAADLVRRSEGESVNLTELQIVCLRLWQSENPELLFKKSRGVKGILREYIDDVFGDLPPEFHDEAIALLSHMITRSNTRNIISENDLLSCTSDHTHVPHEQLHETLDALCGSQLIRRERRRELHFYELASEYFVPWIKEKLTERAAVDNQIKAREERQALVQQRAQAMREWRRARRSKRLVRIVGVLLVVLFLLGAVAGYLYKRSIEANRQLAAADQERRAADLKAQNAQQQQERYEAAIKAIAGQNDDEKLQALAQIKKWIEQRDFPPRLVLLLVAAQSTTENPLIKQTASQLLAQAAQTDANLTQSIDDVAQTDASLAEKLPPRFFIHIAADNQLPQAQKIANALRQQGWVVPGIQNVAGVTFTWDNELRYFRRSEADAALPEKIIGLLKETTGSNWRDAYNPRYEKSPKVSPGLFEVWFAAPTGRLTVSLVDEEGNPLKSLLSFQPTAGGGGVSFKSRSNIISVPPGDYTVVISATGHKPLSRPLFIRAGEQVDWPAIQLSKDNSAQ